MKNLPVLEGFWWTPDHPEKKLPGRLVEEAGKASLNLTVANLGGGPFSEQEPRDYEVIHGRISSGEAVSLLDCFDLRISWSAGIEQRMIGVNYVLLGGFVPAKNETKGQFSELHLKWPELNRWFLHSGVHIEHDADEFRSFTLRYEPREEIAFTLSDGLKLHFKFGTESIPFGGSLADNISIKEVVWILGKPKDPADIQLFLNLIEELKHFFSICVLDYFEPEEITLIGNFDIEERDDGSIIPPRLKFYRSHIQSSRSDRKPHPTDFLVPFVAVKDSFASVMEGWHKLAQIIFPARSLYFSSLYGKRQYIESTFLSLVQSSEVFHRRNYGGTYISQEEYETNILPHLERAIPEILREEVRNSFRQRLVFLNEYSLAKRLKLMIHKHREIFDEFVPKWKDKIRGIVMARNYFTHYSSSGSNLMPDVNDLVDYVDVLRLVMELEMMTESGVDQAVLHDHAKKSVKYRRIFHPDRWGQV